MVLKTVTSLSSIPYMRTKTKYIINNGFVQKYTKIINDLNDIRRSVSETSPNLMCG